MKEKEFRGNTSLTLLKEGVSGVSLSKGAVIGLMLQHPKRLKGTPTRPNQAQSRAAVSPDHPHASSFCHDRSTTGRPSGTRARFGHWLLFLVEWKWTRWRMAQARVGPLETPSRPFARYLVMDHGSYSVHYADHATARNKCVVACASGCGSPRLDLCFSPCILVFRFFLFFCPRSLVPSFCFSLFSLFSYTLLSLNFLYLDSDITLALCPPALKINTISNSP